MFRSQSSLGLQKDQNLLSQVDVGKLELGIYGGELVNHRKSEVEATGGCEAMSDLRLTQSSTI